KTDKRIDKSTRRYNPKPISTTLASDSNLNSDHEEFVETPLDDQSIVKEFQNNKLNEYKEDSSKKTSPKDSPVQKPKWFQFKKRKEWKKRQKELNQIGK
ncbi:MAG TPA: hypothetical protein DGG95_11530, partial [Cytophagales bacterium]|nr:hypothetical protein [Cytophagales bacterium]